MVDLDVGYFLVILLQFVPYLYKGFHFVLVYVHIGSTFETITDIKAFINMLFGV